MLDVQRVDFVSVPTRDVARARRFYGETLGLRESTTPDDAWPEFETSNVTLSIWEPERVGMPFAPSLGVALRVPDVADARKRLEAGGVEFERDTYDSGVCHMAFFKDPDGNSLLLHNRYAPPRHHGESREAAASRQS
jgi:catechol 2,3-dioxygenase-like lactoylglutathione lyase family enzyme